MKLTVEDLLKHSFVITIDRERYSMFKRIFKAHGLDKPYPRKFDGVTLWYNSPQYNCYLSHREAIEKAKKLKWPYVCIFEDDAYPCVGVKEELDKYLSEIPDDCAALALGWISMLSNSGVDGDFINEICCYGSHAYVVFEEHYDDYIELLDKNPEGDGAFYATNNNDRLPRSLFYGTKKNMFIQFSTTKSVNNSCGYVYSDPIVANGKLFVLKDNAISEEKVVEMGFPRISELFPSEEFNVPKVEDNLVKMRVGNLRQGLLDFISSIDMVDMTMIEVGSYAGEGSDMFASSGKVKTLWCIDPWMMGYDEKDAAAFTNMVVVEKEFDKVVERHPETIHKYKGVLEGFIKDHPEVRPDLIYIDACHTYEGCKNDIINALKLNPKIISGHDYTVGWPGVMMAVKEVVGEPDMTFCDGSWIKRLS